ncbi:MAG: hypothetical protein WAO83_10975 [Fuerstiella sp.]
MTLSSLFRLFLTSLVLLGHPFNLCYSQQGPSGSTTTPGMISASGVSVLKAPEPKSEPVAVRDIKLLDGGTLKLKVLSLDGRQVPQQVVQVQFQQTVIAATKTNESGEVVISGLRPGVHIVHSGDAAQAYRFWAPETAPPAAISNPAFVVGMESALGQYGPPMMAPGFLATTVTATALAAVLIGKNRGKGSEVAVPASP